jgi:hypothetical protein
MNFVWEMLAICMYNDYLAMLIENSLGKQTGVPCHNIPLGNCPFALARSLILL